MSEHTKGEIDYRDFSDRIIIVGGENKSYICTVQIKQTCGGAIAESMEDVRKANAAHIKLCWNSHDTLTKQQYDLDKELRDIRPYAHCYKDVCRTLGIEKDILGYIEALTKQRGDLLTACKVVVDRLGIICADGGTMQDFLDAGAMGEIVAAKSAISAAKGK